MFSSPLAVKVRLQTQFVGAGDPMLKMMMLGSVFVFLSSGDAVAQMRMSVGFVVGGSYNVHTGSDLPKTATGVGFVGGGQVDIAFSKTLGILTTVYAYDNRIGTYSDAVTRGAINYEIDATVTVAYAGIEPLLKITMPDNRFYLVAGPNIGIKVDGGSEANTTITTPGYSFPNGFSFQTSTAELTDINTRIEFTIGGGYVFEIDRQSRLTTQLSLGYGLNNIQKNVDWRINSVRLIAGLEFDIAR